MKKALLLLFVAACASVLGFKTKATFFPHRKHVLAGVPCTKCHVGMDKDNGTTLHIPDADSCRSCHAKPHDDHDCMTCHVPEAALAQLGEARDHLKFDHSRHLPRAKGNCMRCHVGVAEGDERMRPPMAECFKCHDQDREARNCDACHKNLETSGEVPQTHLAHDGDWLNEHGRRAASSGDACQSCHTERFCAGCHGVTVPALPSELHFTDPFTPSVHRAGFQARHALEAKSDPGQCQICHQPDRCVSCHVSKGVAGASRANPHPPGWVGLTAADSEHGREARRDPAACAACHGGAGETLCVQCHKVGGVGGNIHPPGWSSNVPLSAMPCRMCHPIGQALPAVGATR